MKKTNASLFYFFALIAISHPGFANAQTADTQTGTNAPKIVRDNTPPPVISTAPIFPTQLPVLPPPPKPNVVVKKDDAVVPAPADASTDAPSADAPKENPPKIVQDHTPPPVVSTKPLWPTTIPNLPAPPKPNVVLRHDEKVDPETLSALHIKLKLKGTSVGLTGSLPKACADALRMDVSPEERSDADDSDDEDSSSLSRSSMASANHSKDISDMKDLDNHTVVYGASVTFKANDKYNTLDDCAKGEEAGDIKSLSGNDKLNKDVVGAKEYARVGFKDPSGKVKLTKNGPKSSAYSKLAALFGFLNDPSDCPTCDFDPGKVKEGNHVAKDLTDLSSSVMKQLLAKGLNEETLTTNLTNLKGISGIRNFRDTLRDYASLIPSLNLSSEDKNSAYALIEEFYGKLQAQVGELVKDEPSKASEYASLISENSKIMAGTPGMTKQFKSDQQLARDSYKKGGQRYIEFVAAYNPASPEVKAYLDHYSQLTSKLSSQVNSQKCQAVKQGQDRNATDINACASADAWLAYYNKMIAPVKSHFVSDQPLAAPTAQNSFYGKPGQAAPKGSMSLASINPNSVSMITAQNGTNANTLFGLNPGVYEGTNLFSPNPPTYEASDASQFRLATPTIGIPLNPGNQVNQGFTPTQSSVPNYTINS